MELKATQLLDLQEYLLAVRPMMLQEIMYQLNQSSKPTQPILGKKPKQVNLEAIENQLFCSENGAKEIKNSIKHLFSAIKKMNQSNQPTPKIASGKIIKQSLIAHWISQYGIRKAQVMAGHRFVSSTECYNQEHLKELTKALETTTHCNEIKKERIYVLI